jgi:hypothetical protein
MKYFCDFKISFDISRLKFTNKFVNSARFSLSNAVQLVESSSAYSAQLSLLNAIQIIQYSSAYLTQFSLCSTAQLS